jgi:hypothetical protein
MRGPIADYYSLSFRAVCWSTQKSADDCCTACFKVGYTCAAFTFHSDTGDCYLKDNTNGNSKKKGVVSGVTGSNPGPSPSARNKTVRCHSQFPPFWLVHGLY